MDKTEIAFKLADMHTNIEAAELLIYDAVNKILNKNKIHSPKLISENWKKNFARKTL